LGRLVWVQEYEVRVEDGTVAGNEHSTFWVRALGGRLGPVNRKFGVARLRPGSVHIFVATLQLFENPSSRGSTALSMKSLGRNGAAFPVPIQVESTAKRNAGLEE
jgi:hypothetical protein